MPLVLQVRKQRFEKERTNNLIKYLESGTKHTANRYSTFKVKTMKCRLPIIIISLFLLLITSDCQKKESSAVSFEMINGNKVLVCDIDKISETRDLKLSEIVESSELIRLSNDTIALVGDTWLRRSSSDYLFLSDMQNKLFLFDNQGNYIRSWDQGNGPNEFIIPGFPQVIDDKVYVQDLRKKNLIEYGLNAKSARTIKIIKSSGRINVTNDLKLLAVGNSTSSEDPYLICLQDFKGNILKSVHAKSHVNLGTTLVGENTTLYPVNSGWRIHLPANDTLMHYSINTNTLIPVAIFHSSSHIEKNKKFYREREKNDINIGSEDLTSMVNVVPEFETSKYYILSVYKFGERENMPWYVATNQTCLVDKKSFEAFYVKFINDFWGDIPFRFRGNSHYWSNQIIQDFSALSIKKQFNELLESQSDKLDNVTKLKIQSSISKIDENDNKIVFLYKLKQIK